MAWNLFRLSPACFVRLVMAMLLFGSLMFMTRGSLSAPPASAETETAGPQDPKEALASFNDLIGEWRGVGMPRRGSNVGAWFETAEWVWDFEEKAPALRYDVKTGQLLETARLTWDPAQKQFHLKAKLPDETTREYAGRLDENKKLVLESAADEVGTSHRITVTQLNEKRTLVLHEKRTGQGLYSRVAEVGYTRSGTSLAVEGAGELECVVTGGKGTMPVSYQGKTYYVCCSGCKQAFDDDPAGIIAEYEKKLAERKTKK
jgi:YHS domain-containing protein